MTYRYLTVLCLWAVCGAFVCQYETTTPSSLISQLGAKDDRVSRRDLAWSMRRQKAIQIIYDEKQGSNSTDNRSWIEKLARAFPEDWEVSTKSEQNTEQEELKDTPLLLIGHQFQTPALISFLKQLPFKDAQDHFKFNAQIYDQPEHSYRLFLYPNPNSRTPVFLIGGNSDEAIQQQLSRNEGESWNDIFWRSWGYEIYEGTEVIVRGNFKDRSWTFEPDNHFDFSGEQINKFSSEHFQFHDYAGLGQAFIEGIAESCEAQIRNLREFTGSRKTIPPIDYYFYPSIEEKGLRLMNTEEGHLKKEEREVHVVVNKTFRGQHTHQDLKLLLHDLLGDADKQFMSEGLSAHFNPQWQEKGAIYWAARLHKSNNLPPLKELIEDDLFERESPIVMTAAAGSLVTFLLEQWDRQIFLQHYRQWSDWSTEEIQALENGWHHFLEGIPTEAENFSTPPLPYYRGFNFAHEGYQIYNGYGSNLAQNSLEKLSRLGTNAVAIVPYGFQRDPQKASFLSVQHGAGSENDESVIYAHAQAQSLGMYTLMKPQLWVSGSWPGDVEMASDDAWAEFFDYYYRWIRHYALIAEIRQFDALCLGVEFSKATLSKPDAWRQMIRRIRGIYSGPITYAANWGEEFEQLSFWDELDFIGLNCYYPLSKADKPNKAELRKNFAEILEKAEKISNKFGKPLVFTEVGFRSVADTWKTPHAEADGRPYDPECQRICYEVLLEGIHKKDWVNGLFIWKWPSYLDYQAHNPVGFTPSGKPAEQVVKRWFEDKLGR